MDAEVPLDEIVLDFRFSEIEHELYAIEQHHASIEAQLPTLLESERSRMQAEALTEHADEEWEIVQDVQRWVDIFIDYELPRLYRYPVLVSLWAVYESAIVDIAKELQKNGSYQLALEDIKGDVLERANKYFEHVLEFRLVTDTNTLAQLSKLYVIRNAIAHANGRKDAIRPTVWQKIESWNHDGISTEQEYLVFSPEFVGVMVKLVRDSLSDLIRRVKEIR